MWGQETKVKLGLMNGSGWVLWDSLPLQRACYSVIVRRDDNEEQTFTVSEEQAARAEGTGTLWSTSELTLPANRMLTLELKDGRLLDFVVTCSGDDVYSIRCHLLRDLDTVGSKQMAVG